MYFCQIVPNIELILKATGVFAARCVLCHQVSVVVWLVAAAAAVDETKGQIIHCITILSTTTYGGAMRKKGFEQRNITSGCSGESENGIKNSRWSIAMKGGKT